MSQSVELALDAKADVGNGILWDAKRQVFYWVDVYRGEVHIYDPTSGHDRAIQVGQDVNTVVPRSSGGVILGVRHGIASLDLDTEQFEIVADPEDRPPVQGFNDGKCDPAGRFWTGAYATDEWEKHRNTGGLYRLDPDLSVHKMLEGVTNSNGIVWSLDAKTMYYIDSPLHRVDAFNYDLATGEIENRRVALDIPKEVGTWPEGMTIDSEGMLWIAYVRGPTAVARWDPVEGRLLETFDVPARPRSCAFGGKNLEQLYITTFRRWVKGEELEKYPLAGGLFVADVGVTGVPAFEFAG